MAFAKPHKHTQVQYTAHSTSSIPEAEAVVVVDSMLLHHESTMFLRLLHTREQSTSHQKRGEGKGERKSNGGEEGAAIVDDVIQLVGEGCAIGVCAPQPHDRVDFR